MRILFGQLLEKIGLIFTPPSGHTGTETKAVNKLKIVFDRKLFIMLLVLS